MNRLNAVCLKVQSARVLRTCGTRQGVAHGGDDVLNAQNKPYQDLMEAFLRPGPNTASDLLPLGLYRRHDAIGENYWFVLSLDASSGLSCLWMHQLVRLVSFMHQGIKGVSRDAFGTLVLHAFVLSVYLVRGMAPCAPVARQAP